MHSLEEIDKKLKLFPRVFVEEKEDDEIKEFMRNYLIPNLFSTLYDENSKIDDIAITSEGREFYEEVNNFNKERHSVIKDIIDEVPKEPPRSSRVKEHTHEIYNLGIYNFYLSSPYYRMIRMICNGDAFNRDNMDPLTLLYLIANAYDVLASYGVDVLVPTPDLEQKNFKNGSNLTKDDLDNSRLQEIEYKMIEEDGEKKYYTRVLKEEFKQKYSEDINRMYDLYYANFEKFNVPTYYSFEILYLFKGNSLFNINVDELIDKYPRVTRDEILTLCLYKLDASSIIRYLEVLNKSDDANKEKLFELIKPMHYHFPYITAETYHDMYTEIGRLKPDNHWREDGFKYINNVINGNTLFDKDCVIDSDNSYGFAVRFRSQFYDGYFYYITSLENFFLKQIDVYEKIVDRGDYQNILNSLLAMRLYILANKMKANEHTNKEMDKVINTIKEFMQKYLNTYLTNDLEYNNDDLRDNIWNKLQDTLHPQEDKVTKLMRNL